MAVVVTAVPFRSSAQEQKNHAEIERMAQKAQAEGAVRVIVHLDVPRIQEFRAASARFAGLESNRAATLARTWADETLRAAVDRTASKVRLELQGTDHRVQAVYRSIPYMALRVSPAALALLEASPAVLDIEEDVPMKLIDPVPDGGGAEGDVIPADGGDLIEPELDTSVNLIGADVVWGKGYTGAGWYVAILDTGIRRTHQFFSGKTIAEACFASGEDESGDCPNGEATMTGPGAAAHFTKSYQGYDHGTHVAGIAAGKYGSRAGVAKGANIIAVNVFSRFSASACGGSKCVMAYDSDIISGLEYVYSLRGRYKIAAANMSLGGGQYSSSCSGGGTKPIIDNLRSAKIATVIATGNDGWCGYTSSPGCVSSAVAVGATDKEDVEAWFSNWHRTIQKVFAPGVGIMSSTGSSNSKYARWNGTSMATPHVTGAWALLRHKFPAETVTQLLSRLRTKGVGIDSSCGVTRIPRIQVDKAMGY